MRGLTLDPRLAPPEGGTGPNRQSGGTCLNNGNKGHEGK